MIHFTRMHAAARAFTLTLAALAGAAGLVAFALELGRPAGARAALAGEPRTSRAPERLSATGLYAKDGSVDPRNRPFAPQYPLWTDGAEKSRWIRLPGRSKIDVSDVDAWRFPPGTTLWKEFAWNGRKVETRMMRVEADGRWTFATYVWLEDQTDAVLAPEEGVAAVFEVAPGKRHSIPGVADCLACHGTASPVLGFTALQLSDDRDPLAPHATALPRGAITLRTLVQEHRLSPARPELAKRPPRIRARDPIERAAIGYLSGNCGSCHNARGPLSRLGFAFLHDQAGDPRSPEPAVATAIGAHGRFSVRGVAPESLQVIAAGVPAYSAVLYRMSSRRPSSQMPPMGTVVPDTAAIALITRWIEGLERSPLAADLAGAPLAR